MNRSLADTTLTGLPPLADSGARVLLLGSMPGAVSLHQQQYYAHPRNLFWPIMANLAGFNADLPYPEKTQALINSGAALWDVIGSCQRSGSLDSAIRDEQVNDFAGFFRCHPELAAIGFNGAKAWQSFKRYVLPLQIVPQHVCFITLPSTSPAHAAMSFDAKLAQWQQLRVYLRS